MRAGHGAEISALLAWWRDAGVDCAVQDMAFDWLAAPVEPSLAALSADIALDCSDIAPVSAGLLKKPAAAARSAAPVPVVTDEGWDRFATPDALLAAVRAVRPLCPIFDGQTDSGTLLVGEAPSAEDLRTGRPFSGPAGQMLDQMLHAIGLDRQTVGITLLTPRREVPGMPADAVARDLPLVRALIGLMQPRRLLLLGGVVSQTLLEDKRPLGRMRGVWAELVVDGFRVAALPTFNPDYLLSRPQDKGLAWADWLTFNAGRVEQ